MIDQRKLRRKVLLALLTAPVTMAPFVIGTTLLAFALAFSHEPGWAAFGGLACVLGAAGTFMTRFLLGADEATREAVAEMEAELHAEREKRLDELDMRLSADDDPRTEAALRDLRAFERAFQESRSWTGRLNATSTFDIVASVQDLFEGSVRALETTLDLWKTARLLRSPEAKRPILARREEIVHDVRASITKLSNILVGIQKLGSDASDSDLARIRGELDESLDVAKRVEEKVRAWQRDEMDVKN